MSDDGLGELRIGVALELRGDVGDMLADARAVEAAGADSLWVDGPGIGAYVVIGALAAVTWRVRLVGPRDTGPAADAAEEDARRVCLRLSGGRLVPPAQLLVADAPPEDAAARFAAAAASHAEIERWIRAPFPDGRPAWDALRRACAEAGATGVVLPNDPRLIDLLRNPDVIEDRSDLKLSFG